METIGNTSIWGLFGLESTPKQVPNTTIRRGTGHHVGSYVDLAQKIAELQFLNRDHVLLFRGQDADHKNNAGLTTMKPTLFRSPTLGKNPSLVRLRRRFRILRSAEERLLTVYSGEGLLGADRLSRNRLLRWSILQHYDVCDTPLLDVSQSLRVAASFATNDKKNEAFVYVLGVPNLSGAVTASSESAMQIVRLSSACPPSAMRPHFQEGYLLGEYPEVADMYQKERYSHADMDFGRRLIAKFRFNPAHFWKSDTFPILAKKALYPTGHRDPLEHLMLELRSEVRRSADWKSDQL